MQKFISNYRREMFESELNDLLKRGAKVVPHTLVCTLSSCPSFSGNQNYSTVMTDERWACVVELPEGS